MPKVVRTEAVKKAQKEYFQRIKGTPMGEKIKQCQRESSKRSFNKKYANDPEFREHVMQMSRMRHYYNDAKNDGVLKCVKHLFGEFIFYGR